MSFENDLSGAHFTSLQSGVLLANAVNQATLAAPSGSALVGYLPLGSGASAKTVKQILDAYNGAASTPLLNPLAPIGNSTTPSYSILDINATSAQAAAWELGAVIGLNANTGSTQTAASGLGNKVALYTGVVGNIGGGNVWSFNPLVTLSSGWTGCSDLKSAYVAEFDLNNNSGTDFGPSSGTTIGNPSATGLMLSGAGANFCSAAVMVLGNIGAGPMWRFGAWFGNNSIQNATIADITNSVNAYILAGTHTIGFDLTGATISNYALKFANNQAVSWKNAVGNADLNCFQLNAGNNLVIGFGLAGIGANISGTTFIPVTTNTYTCGNSGAVWSQVWTQQAQITSNDGIVCTNQTSDSGAQTATFTNAPTAGNPAYYLRVNINGANYAIPCLTA